MNDQAPRIDLPVFSERLDELMAAMLKGEVPNVGRFCGYCYTPLAKNAAACAHCSRSIHEYPPAAKIPSDLFPLYRRLRRRESLIVNAFAFAGLGLGLVLFIALAAIGVYRFNASVWWLASATAVLLIGGRIFAGILGGWIGDAIGYDYAHRRLVLEWQEYERKRAEAFDRAFRSTDAEAPSGSASPAAPAG